jgi:hypothetical protein
MVNGISQTNQRALRKLKLGRSRSAAYLHVLCGLFALACTLTRDEFEPRSASEQGTAQSAGAGGSGDAGSSEPAPGRACTDASGCCDIDADCSAGEACVAGSCAVPSCVGGEETGECVLQVCPGPDCAATPSLGAARCDDGLRNGTEPAVDCGRGCPERCAAEAACEQNQDCASLRCADNRCAAATCADEVANQDETDTDCGGSCPPCQGGADCQGDGDCAAGLFCAPASGVCTDASCQDGTRSGAEVLIDCGGGSCPGCPPGTSCLNGADCDSRVCDSNGNCAASSCADGEQNGTETDTDCGGANPGCDRCPEQGTCLADGDCVSADCNAGRCAAASTCNDDIRNGNETGVDCGGSDPGCQRCPDGAACNQASDCGNANCQGGLCISCEDGLRNASESDVDCGGANLACSRCAPSRRCQADSDCDSGACQDGSCCGGNQGDCTRCAQRLSRSVDCDQPTQGVDPTGVINCNLFLQCLTNNPLSCPTRNTPGCSGDNPQLDACPHNTYGGNAGTGVTRATQVLQDAACQL